MQCEAEKVKRAVTVLIVLVFSVIGISCNSGNPYGVSHIGLSRISSPEVEIRDGREITKIMSFIENVEKTEYPKPDETIYGLITYTMSIHYSDGNVKYFQIWDERRFVEWTNSEDKSSYHFFAGNVSDMYIYLRYNYPVGR